MKHEARVWKQLILNLKARDNFEYPAVGTISFLSGCDGESSSSKHQKICGILLVL
jgi:hypothetical protein